MPCCRSNAFENAAKNLSSLQQELGCVSRSISKKWRRRQLRRRTSNRRIQLLIFEFFITDKHAFAVVTEILAFGWVQAFFACLSIAIFRGKRNAMRCENRKTNWIASDIRFCNLIVYLGDVCQGRTTFVHNADITRGIPIFPTCAYYTLILSALCLPTSSRHLRIMYRQHVLFFKVITVMKVLLHNLETNQ